MQQMHYHAQAASAAGHSAIAAPQRMYAGARGGLGGLATAGSKLASGSNGSDSANGGSGGAGSGSGSPGGGGCRQCERWRRGAASAPARGSPGRTESAYESGKNQTAQAMGQNGGEPSGAQQNGSQQSAQPAPGQQASGGAGSGQPAGAGGGGAAGSGGSGGGSGSSQGGGSGDGGSGSPQSTAAGRRAGGRRRDAGAESGVWWGWAVESRREVRPWRYTRWRAVRSGRRGRDRGGVDDARLCVDRGRVGAASLGERVEQLALDGWDGRAALRPLEARADAPRR